ncbi:MAG: hypothetical protein FWF96_05850, partial [Kiritimatiellaeota bacterium]|nr:hypothetical protein [Kiritimatiellota bacterium]
MNKAITLCALAGCAAILAGCETLEPRGRTYYGGREIYAPPFPGPTAASPRVVEVAAPTGHGAIIVPQQTVLPQPVVYARD